MSLLEDNANFEDWLRDQCDVVDADLKIKHDRMSKNAFLFLRATFFRWARIIERLCPELAEAPAVLAVGDAHLGNFGTWRDAEGRLVWGVNDFDDAAEMPYAFDLVRLCTSVRLADKLTIKPRAAATAIVHGYRQGLKAPRPAFLDGEDSWLLPFLEASARERGAFWDEIDELPAAEPDKAVRDGFDKSFPGGVKQVRFAAQTKGGGGLGRPRYVASGLWRGGRIAREAKALVPSAWHWAHDAKSGKSRFVDLADSKHRAPDPSIFSHKHFLFRRVSPDARKLDLDQGVPAGLEGLFLGALGFELASLHAADHDSEAIAPHLEGLSADWLVQASMTAAEAVREDFATWKAANPKKSDD